MVDAIVVTSVCFNDDGNEVPNVHREELPIIYLENTTVFILISLKYIYIYTIAMYLVVVQKVTALH